MRVPLLCSRWAGLILLLGPAVQSHPALHQELLQEIEGPSDSGLGVLQSPPLALSSLRGPSHRHRWDGRTLTLPPLGGASLRLPPPPAPSRPPLSTPGTSGSPTGLRVFPSLSGPQFYQGPGLERPQLPPWLTAQFLPLPSCGGDAGPSRMAPGREGGSGGKVPGVVG